MEKLNFDYFQGNENEQYLYLQLPLMLFKDNRFKPLSDSAKIVYSFLLNRTSLSAKNGWRDDEGRVYIIYTIAEIMEDLNCWKEKATKAMKELKEIGLIKTIRQGLTKPNLIYVMNFATEFKYSREDIKEPKTTENTQKSENRTSDVSEIELQDGLKVEPQDFRKSNPSKNHRNKNNFKKIDVDKSMSTSDAQPKNFSEEKPVTNDFDIDIINPIENISANNTASNPKQVNKSDNPTNNIPVYDYDTYKKIIHKNISYEHFKQHSQFGDLPLIDELVECMLDVITTQSTRKVKINSELKDRQLVINKYLTLHDGDIQHVLAKYQEQYGKITHVSSYLKTLLYTVKQESNHFYTNAVRADGLLSTFK